MIGRVASMKEDRVTEILEFEVPKPEKGAVIMEVLKANVCGSDIHIWEGKHILKRHVMGHHQFADER